MSLMTATLPQLARPGAEELQARPTDTWLGKLQEAGIPQLRGAGGPQSNIGVLTIRIGFWGPLCGPPILLRTRSAESVALLSGRKVKSCYK